MKCFPIVVIIGMLFCGSAMLFAGQDYSGAKYVGGHLIVSFSDRLGHELQGVDGKGQVVNMGIPSVDELLARYNVTEMRRIVSDQILGMLDFPPDFYRSMLLICPDNTDILKMLSDFEQNPYVESTQPDLLKDMYDRVPNDAYWQNQWDKRLMHLPAAWDFTTGSRSIMVVAVDGGTWWKHEDFYANLWVNPGEDINGDSVAYTDTTYPGDQADIDGADNDGDGLVDDLIGWDFIQGPLSPPCAAGEDCDHNQDNDPVSLEDHGTHVLGLMGAVGNNGIGVAGCNWNIKIVPCRAGYLPATQPGGLIVTTAAVPCMLWAVGKGARLVNMSYGSSYNSSMEQNAITACWNQGAILVAAAGNDHVSSPFYPAADNHVVSVGSVDDGDIVSSFSNYGTWVDIFAPGGSSGGQGVISTVVPGYVGYEGTSMASPNTAGVFALLWSLFPDMTNQELIDYVFAHCRDITAVNPSYNPTDLGHGRVDAMLPLASIWPNPSVSNPRVSGDNDHDGRLESGETGNLTLSVHNDSLWSIAQNVTVTISTDDPNLVVSNATFVFDAIAPGATVENTDSPVQISVPGSIPDAYWTTLTANITADGGFSQHRTFTLRIGRPQTLVVGDDGADNYQSFFISALTAQGYFYNYDAMNIHLDGDPSLASITEYEVIIWVCGNESTNTLTADNQSVLSQWLNSGNKRLLLAGQNIDEDIHGTSFYSDYLHSQTAGTTTDRSLRGVDGDPISNGTSLLLIGGGCGGNGNNGPSKISGVNGGVVFYNYGNQGQDGGGAVHFDNSTYKVAYFAFAIEAACGASGTTHYSIVLRDVMQWFGARPTGVEPHPVSTLPTVYALKTNYPNPFNPVTTISFELPRTAKVSLIVFDMLGRQVAVLANGTVPAGAHSVVFDGTELASGTYFAHLQADGFGATQKMLLLK